MIRFIQPLIKSKFILFSLQEVELSESEVDDDSTADPDFSMSNKNSEVYL